MGKAITVLLWLLLTFGAASAQNASALPNWLTGIIAVAVFLFLVFVAFIVNKAWCETPSESQEIKVELPVNEYVMSNGSNHGTNLDSVRSTEHYEVYENVLVHKTEEKVTAL